MAGQKTKKKNKWDRNFYVIVPGKRKRYHVLNLKGIDMNNSNKAIFQIKKVKE